MKFRSFFSGLIAVLLVSSAAWADPPGRVGRVTVQGGSVLLANAGADWREIGQNYPVTHGDNLHVAPGGRVEIDFGSGSAWLTGGSTVFFERLDDHHFRARIAEGQMIVRIREIDRGETARVELRRGGVELIAPGLYRFEVESGASRAGHDLVHVKSGSAELSSGAGFEPLRGGDAVEFDGYRIGFLNIRGDDSFGAWADSRDRRYENQRYAYVSPYMVGARDLDEHGAWRENSTYGWVWFPRRVASDWAPYRFGHWTHIAPWGWTWVDDAPWGFAPFHYGRWVSINGRWGWCPGPWERRPIYSPALVAWHGNFGTTALGVGSPLVYWTPLAWGEAYYPSYAVSANFWRIINRPYISQTVVYSPAPPRGYEYRNWRVPGGATAVEAAVIANARPVAPALRAMGPLPTTSQVEAVSITDRIKPAYVGATGRSGGSVESAAPRTSPTIQEAGVVRAMPPQSSNTPPPSVPGYVPPGRVSAPIQTQPAPYPSGREAAAIPTQPAPVTSAQPPRSAPVPAQPAPAPSALREQAIIVPNQSSSQPPVSQAPQRALPGSATQAPTPLPSQPPSLQPQSESRRVQPTQNRGEAPPARPVQPFVEPLPRSPRAVAPQPATPPPAPQPAPQQDRSRRGDDKPDREKSQR